jgi:small subunit ribosomal protein S4
MDTKQCRICRRSGTKLFLKGDRCVSTKCSLIKRPYSPGEKRKRKRGGVSEYGAQLAEKQRLKNWYNLRERQFSGYVKRILSAREKGEDAGVLLVRQLETRLDNLVFRLGLASSRRQARQFVNHGHFLINGKRVSIPSCQVKKNDIVTIHPSSAKKVFFKNAQAQAKKVHAPSWVKFDPEKMEAKIIGLPNLEESAPPVELLSIFEFYSK